MHNSKIITVLLAAILFTGALTAAIPSFMVNAEASNDKNYIKDKDVDGEDVDSEASSDEEKDNNVDSEASSDEEKDNNVDSEASSDKEKNNNVDSEASNYKKDNNVDSEASNYKKDNNVDSEASNYKKDNNVDSEASSDQREIKYKDINQDKYASYSKSYQDYNQKSIENQDTYSKEKGYYDDSSSYGQVYTKPSYGTDYGNDYDKKIIKKIIVVCPDGSKVPVDRDNSIMTGVVTGGEENGFIDNVIEEVCPAIDSCEECFEWILNFADNRTESVAIVNTVIDALNEQTPTGQPDLDVVEVDADGYEGPNLWEICEFFNGLVEDSINQGQAISALRSTIQETIQQSVDAGEVTPIVGSLAIDIIECIAELEGIELPLTPTNGNNNQNQALEIPLTSSSSGTIR
jgi:hypothetical protein